MVESTPHEKDIMGRLTVLERGHLTLKSAVETNTAITMKIKEDTTEMVELFTGAKKATGLLIGILKMVRWVGGVAIAITAMWVLYTAFKTGSVPNH